MALYQLSFNTSNSASYPLLSCFLLLAIFLLLFEAPTKSPFHANRLIEFGLLLVGYVVFGTIFSVIFQGSLVIPVFSIYYIVMSNRRNPIEMSVMALLEYRQNPVSNLISLMIIAYLKLQRQPHNRLVLAISLGNLLLCGEFQMALIYVSIEGLGRILGWLEQSFRKFKRYG